MQKLLVCCSVWLWLGVADAAAQAWYGLRRETDSLYVLSLHTDSTSHEWPLRYPVYAFCTGDVDGDGLEDALVGVVKRTRYSPEVARRLFIFKNYHGKIRPLWMGSRLGGPLLDFRFIGGRVRALQTTSDGRYVVAEYEWLSFGLTFSRFLAVNVSAEEARRIFDGGEDVSLKAPDNR